MTHFEWNADLETGNADVDDQHRRLFEIANRLQDATSVSMDDADAVPDTIYELTDYVVQHFNDEQALMEAASYPSLPAHRALHEHLTAEVLALAAAYFNGEDVAAERIAPFLADWLQAHIRAEDMQYVAFIHETRRDL